MTEKSKTRLLGRKELAWLVLSLIGLYVIVPQLGDFKHSWHLLSSPSWYFVGLASLTTLLTYLFASITLLCLSVKRLSIVEMFIVQIAINFINRLLPAGIGGIGANIQYLRHKGYDIASSAAIIATNNILGIIGHVSIIILTLLLVNHEQKLPKFGFGAESAIIIGAGLLALAVSGLILYRHKKKQVEATLHRLRQQLMYFAKNPLRLGLALLSQMLLTIMNVLALYYSARAVGINLELVPALIIFTFGSAVRNFTPTPGGVGGFEAGLVAGLVAYKAGSNQALAAVLLYRLISYWAPLVIGGLTFIYAQKKRLLES